MVEIIYSCEEYVAAVKPYGVLSEWDESRPNMIDEIADTLGVTRGSVYPVHRLDATTEGIMIYALTKKAAADLSRSVTDGSFRKTYLAFITAADDLSPSGEMHDFLFFDRRAGKTYIADSRKKGAKEAFLTYSLEDPFEWHGIAVTPARIELQTGRTHQIRAQFASRRSPLLGDGKYGSRVNYKKPSLFSVSVEFCFRGERAVFSIEDRISKSVFL